MDRDADMQATQPVSRSLSVGGGRMSAVGCCCCRDLLLVKATCHLQRGEFEAAEWACTTVLQRASQQTEQSQL